MASSSRQTTPTVEEQLFTESYRFNFYKAVQLLEKLAANAQPRLKVLLLKFALPQLSVPLFRPVILNRFA